MTEMDGGAAGASPGISRPDYSSGLHDPAEVQRYASDIERLAGAVARDEKRARELIDAVHSGSGANVEKLFRDAGVESRVSIETTDVTTPSEVEGVGEVAADSTSTTHKTHHVEVHIDIGPIHLSASYDKETDTSTVTH